MKLYIANTTLQIQHVHYRVPEQTRQAAYDQIIRPGEQASIWKDGTESEIMAIVAQLEVYGLVKASEVHHTKKFVGLCYSLDKPVRPEVFLAAHRHNKEVREAEAEERMTAEIQTGADHMARVAQEHGLQLNAVETEIVQENGGDRDTAPVSRAVRAEVQAPRSGGKKQPARGAGRRGR